MLHIFSWQVWLLLFIVVGSAISLLYLSRHLTRSPARYNPPGHDDDFSWRTARKLKLHLAALAGFAIAGVLVARGFPPGTFGPSIPFTAPALLAAWAVQSVIDGLRTGRIQVMDGGLPETVYENNPMNFLLVIIVNLFIGFFGMIVSALFIALNLAAAP
jgi:hypothetical protein